MVHLTSLIAAHQGPFHTYEFFPLAQTRVSSTSSTVSADFAPRPSPLRWPSDRTLGLAEEVVKLGVEVILHLTCTNMPKAKVDQALSKAKELGIQNILALRGDQPRSAEYATTPNPEPDFFTHADDLVRYIRAEHGSYFCIGVAGYPTPHPDSESAETEMHWLKVKCDAGADFIVTQLFYDVPHFAEWVKDCRAKGITQPIIPGVMPIQSFSSFRRLVNLTKVPVPDSIMADLEPIRSDDAAVKRYGAQLATNMVRRLLASGVVPGVHFCTLNLEKSVRTILENLDWKSPTPNARQSSPLPRHNQLIDIDDDGAHSHGQLAAVPQEFSGMSISPAKASQLAEWGLTHSALPPAPKKSTGAPSGAPGQGEDSWDEYPNGRFTDVRSPAYGEIDGWGSGLKITLTRTPQAAQALKDWGTPTTPADLSNLFTAYLRALPSTPTTPFCDLPLSPESTTILPHLLALNSADMQHWTVGSQPAVDSARSDDAVHGWGPTGGYVFQKAFVEFFVPAQEVERLEERLKRTNNEQISMYAANKEGDFKTNTLKDAVNAVTWGVFPGQEIVQSTIIEETSFLAWKEEAFDIWSEWSLLYPRSSPARKLLEGIASDWWLVSLIHHDYKDTGALWRFLLEEKEA
ncbi:hypothetical protein EHS25_004996 [Saitozyma podzolica]|uniref:MTHFR SAM-binding regulatory domain-containing protein n=1 Tax=Saitozyma podzolica TaxID=1890683 RepID=A0A427Y288_9TREE|nr:hypothetical protein EHS25_004996 [Saitozyma podzolica]